MCIAHIWYSSADRLYLLVLSMRQICGQQNIIPVLRQLVAWSSNSSLCDHLLSALTVWHLVQLVDIAHYQQISSTSFDRAPVNHDP